MAAHRARSCCGAGTAVELHAKAGRAHQNGFFQNWPTVLSARSKDQIENVAVTVKVPPARLSEAACPLHLTRQNRDLSWISKRASRVRHVSTISWSSENVKPIDARPGWTWRLASSII